LTHPAPYLDNHAKGHAATLAVRWSKDGVGDGIRDMVIEKIEIHFDEDAGHLRLDCADEEFIHIRDLVLSEASVTDQVQLAIDGIQSIVVRRKTALRETTPGRIRRRLVIFLVSSALFVAVVIQVVGIIAIARWLLERGS
jgi:hypothetical protein